jgi:hypothetical protein
LRLSRNHIHEGSVSLIALLILVLSLAFLALSFNPLISSQADKTGPTIRQSESASNVSSASNNPTFWYVGASSNDPISESNVGLRAYIQVRNQTIKNGVLSFWISEAFTDNLWAQVGYYIQNNSGTIAFYQVWNLTDRSELVTGTQSVSNGIHLFCIELIRQTDTWTFSMDNKSFGSFDMLANLSSASYPMYAMSEEGYAQSPFPFYPVVFPSAIQVYKSDSWHSVLYASSFGNNWGIQGHEQNSLLGEDEIAIGESYQVLAVNSILWTQ